MHREGERNEQQGLEASVRVVGGVPVIDLRGELDGSGGDLLAAVTRTAEREGAKLIALNFTEVGFINSKGIALIVNQIMRAREEGYELVAYGLSNHYRQIFTITRLTDFIHVTDDEENAVKTLSLIT